MPNLPARQADLGVALQDLKTLITNCTTDIAAADSDSEPIRRLKEQAESAMESFGFSGAQEGTSVT